MKFRRVSAEYLVDLWHINDTVGFPPFCADPVKRESLHLSLGLLLGTTIFDEDHRATGRIREHRDIAPLALN